MTGGTSPCGRPCPPYSWDAVPLGPFADEPVELRSRLGDAPTGAVSVRPASEARWCGRHWLAGALHEAGVRLGAYDRVAIRLIADDGFAAVQVVAGWVARAGDPGSAAPAAWHL